MFEEFIFMHFLCFICKQTFKEIASPVRYRSCPLSSATSFVMTNCTVNFTVFRNENHVSTIATHP